MCLLCNSACTHHQVKLLLHPTVVQLQLLAIHAVLQVIAIHAVVYRIIACGSILGILVLFRYAVVARQGQHHLQQVVRLVQWLYIGGAQRVAIRIVARVSALIHHGQSAQLVKRIGLRGAIRIAKVHICLHGQGATRAHKFAVVDGAYTRRYLLRLAILVLIAIVDAHYLLQRIHHRVAVKSIGVIGCLLVIGIADGRTQDQLVECIYLIL